MLVKARHAVPQIGERGVAYLFWCDQVEALAAHVDPGHQGPRRPWPSGDGVGDDGFGDPASRSGRRHHGQHLVLGCRFHRPPGPVDLGIADQQPAAQPGQPVTVAIIAGVHPDGQPCPVPGGRTEEVRSLPRR